MLVALAAGAPVLAADSPAPAKLYFDTGKADVPADAATALAPMIAYVKTSKDTVLAVSGFHDKTGDPAANATLAKNRALAVKGVLIAAGLADGSVVLMKPAPSADGGPDDKEARRVEVLIATAEMIAAAKEYAAAADAPAAAPAPSPNKGDNAWMIVATVLVIMMSIPGLALFYGGLVRSKNMLSILMQVFVVFSLIVVLWVVYGYSLAFTEGSAFIGGFDRVLMSGIFSVKDGVGSFTTAATFSKGVVIPELLFVVFQATFAAITVALIVGSFAERAKFSAVLLFAVLWFTFAYLPIAHMVWFWPGPDVHQGRGYAGIRVREGRLAVAEGRARLRRRHRRAHQCRRGGPGGRLRDGQADRLRTRLDGPAQPDVHDDRRLAAVGGLVRVQRRIRARSR